jgi:hypothetical protein
MDVFEDNQGGAAGANPQHVQQQAAHVAAQVAHQVAGQAAAAAAQQAAHQAAAAAAQHAAAAAQQAVQQQAHAAAQAAQQAAFNAVANAGLQRELAKAYKPERFALSRKDTQKVNNFFYRIEKYFNLLGVHDDATKVELATFAFDGDVAVWWRSRYEGQVRMWQALKDRVYERWADENDMQRARNQLRTLKQTGSAASATAVFDSLCLRIPGITDEEKRDKYMAMLKPHIQKELLLCSGLDTYEKLAQRAVLVDDTLYHFRRDHYGGGGGNSGGDKMELGHMGASDSSSGDSDSDEELNAMGGRKQSRYKQQKNGGWSKKGAKHNSGGSGSGGSGKKGGKKDLSSIKCFRCGKYGHYASKCTSPRDDGGEKSPNERAQAWPYA